MSGLLVSRLVLLVWYISTVSASDSTCGSCVSMVDIFASTYISPLTEEEFKGVWSTACHTLKGDQMEHCMNINNKYSKDLYDHLTSDEGAAKICAVFDQCKNGDKIQLDYTFSCSDCKSQAKTYQQNLKKFTDSALKKKMNTVICSGLASGKMENCKDLVDQFVPLLTFVAKNMDLSFLFCTAVNTCPATSTLQSQMVKFYTEKKSVGIDDTSCTQCKAYVALGRSLIDLSDSAFDSSKVCKSIPLLGDKCTAFFDLFGGVVVDAIKNKLDDTAICTSVLGFCDGSALESPEFVLKTEPIMETEVLDMETYSSEMTPECKKCLASVDLLRSLLDLTDAAFDASMVCKQLPFIGSKCTDFMSKYGDIIYNSINNKLNSTEICETELGLCSPEETDDFKYAEDTEDTDDTDNKIFAYPESRARFFSPLLYRMA